MSGIWTNRGDGWKLDAPQAFLDEASLHRLIQENPNLLPLAGSPRLMVLGSEVQLGNGYADILAVEPSGRPAVIEFKLASNREARREIVSQVLAYAASLQGFSVEGLERGPLRLKLMHAGHGSILEAVQAQDQEGAVDAETFTDSLQDFLDQGNFRLVLVLDEVSADLERIVAYLDRITIHALTVDLISLNVYEVNGAQVALPQRVSPSLSATPPSKTTGRGKSPGSGGDLTDGADVFRDSIADIAGESRVTFDTLIEWAEQLSSLSNVRLYTFTGKDGKRFTLLPRIMPDNAGLVTIWNDEQRPSISVWRSVFDRLAPGSVSSVERVIAPTKFGQGNSVQDFTSEVLEALRAAYEEAAGK